MRDYLRTVVTSLLTPWRTDLGPLQQDSSWRIVAILVFHLSLAGAMAAIPSSWTYLVGKGMVLGVDEMDLAGDDVPPNSVHQVALGLVASIGIWMAVSALCIGVCVVAADGLFIADRVAFRLAVRRACLLSAWLVVWSSVTVAANLERGHRLVHPARWPWGESWEIRDRLIFAAVGFPIIWAVGLNAGDSVVRRRFRWIWVGAALAICWFEWWLIWRALPWISLEAYSG